MFFEDDEKQYKLVAPDIDALLRYCESLFPDEYGEIIDFTYVYKGEDEWFDEVTWLPEDPAELKEG